MRLPRKVAAIGRAHDGLHMSSSCTVTKNKLDMWKCGCGVPNAGAAGYLKQACADLPAAGENPPRLCGVDLEGKLKSYMQQARGGAGQKGMLWPVKGIGIERRSPVPVG